MSAVGQQMSFFIPWDEFGVMLILITIIVIITISDGERTMEGTAFNVIAQMVAIYMLHIFGN